MNVDEFHDRLKELYLPPEGRFTLVDVPDIRYAVIDGQGDPASEARADAVRWLYSLVHLVKPIVKERMGKNFVEPPIEYLIWSEDEEDFTKVPKERWRWKAMIVFIDWISQAQFEAAVSEAEQKLGPAPASLRLESVYEGQSVQILHVGDYSELAGIAESLYSEYLPEHNLRPAGRYHEIYLNDPARTAPEKRRTVLRQPVVARG